MLTEEESRRNIVDLYITVVYIIFCRVTAKFNFKQGKSNEQINSVNDCCSPFCGLREEVSGR